VVVLIGVVALFSAWRSFLFLTGRAGEAYVYNAFDTRADILAIGCLLAFASRAVPFQRWCQGLARSSLFPLITAALLLTSRMTGSRAYHYSIGFTVDAILLAVLIAQILLLHDRPLWRWLDHPVARYLGAISYPLYLYHIWGYGSARKLAPAGPTLVRVGIAIVASILLASLSYYVVERPFMRLKMRFSPARAPRDVRSLQAVVAP
jgi:peptidoglycan/LPS O-acetylase OafA/YrhL